MRPRNLNPIILVNAALAIASMSHGATVIYEPFTFIGADTVLNANAGGTGLSGNWNAAAYNKDTGLTYGTLPTSGDSVRVSGGWSSAQVGINTGATGYSALLANGGEMWFSMIMQVGATNNRSYFALSNNGVGGSNGDLSGGYGVGFGLASNGVFYANVWDDVEAGNWGGNNLTGVPTGDVATTTGTGTVATHFVVGRVQWGANSAANDTVTLYLPGTDRLLGSAVSSSTGVITDQSGIDLLGFQNLTNFNVFDEIRVGATSADVGIIPEPSAALLGGLGMLALLRRRS
jgi:hypothetical protein